MYKLYPFGKTNTQQASVRAHTLPKITAETRINLSINYNTKNKQTKILHL
jgi:hypothetical protein